MTTKQQDIILWCLKRGTDLLITYGALVQFGRGRVLLAACWLVIATRPWSDEK